MKVESGREQSKVQKEWTSSANCVVANHKDNRKDNHKDKDKDKEE